LESYVELLQKLRRHHRIDVIL